MYGHNNVHRPRGVVFLKHASVPVSAYKQEPC